jgi:L-ascorbate metabolism protein UlaG (beta-lactamase superfamily)
VKRIVKAAAIAAGAAGVAIGIERMFATARHSGPASDHFDGDRFFNPDPTRQDEGSFIQWMLSRERGYWPRWVDAAPGPKPPKHVDDLRITFINHATTLIQIDGVNIITDPVYAERVSPVAFAGPKRHRPPGIRFDDLPPIDIVLVSHNHYDHLDVGTLHRIHWRHKPRIYTPLGNGRLMARFGIPNAIELDWWERNDRITAVPSQHFSARAISDRDRNLWGGFVIHSDRGNVYFAGDTGWGSHFAEIGRRFTPIRLALIPIGAYLPRWFMKPAHIDPAEAVKAHEALNAGTSMAIHFGTFALGDDGEMEPVRDLERAIGASGKDLRFWILNHGEGRDVP